MKIEILTEYKVRKILKEEIDKEMFRINKCLDIYRRRIEQLEEEIKRWKK